MDEYIKKQDALDAILSEPPEAHYPSWYAEKIKMLSTTDVVPLPCAWLADCCLASSTAFVFMARERIQNNEVSQETCCD